MFGAISYLAYTFTRVTGFSSTDVARLRVVYGSGLVIGNMVGGRTAERNRDLTLIASLAGLTVTLTTFGLPAAGPTASVVLVFLTGLFGFASAPARSRVSPTTLAGCRSPPAPTSLPPASATSWAPGSAASP
ncbi:hypothetical protein [Streptomyces sp. NPDC051636]|uniref:hypothetical protein n=1 Tax=Streptomyces sp. NPDC051636 TaxID=3365663 RepID=UPI0037B8D6C6